MRLFRSLQCRPRGNVRAAGATADGVARFPFHRSKDSR
jgi:hypothetical protein